MGTFCLLLSRMKPIPFWKRKYVVDKKFQFEITGYFLSFYFIVLVALYLFLRFSILGSFEDIQKLESINTGTLDLLKEHLMQILNFVFIIFTMVGGGFAFAGGIFISNKISGPIFRLQKVIQQMTIGNYQNYFKVRKGDYCEKLFDEVEKLNQTLMEKSKV